MDIGIASVGAALLLPEQERILALHVRAFDRAETADRGESLNKIRRDARSVRRRLRRRKFRLLRTRRLLRREGLVTSTSSSELAAENSNPWTLRAEGLDRLLQPREWAAVLYHLVKHRGFQSNRKSEAKSDAKAGEMLKGVSANKERLLSANLRTVGELAARHGDFASAKRNKGGDYSHTFARSDIVTEAIQLFATQKTLGNRHAGDAFRDQLIKLLMQRRPTLSGNRLLKMVGKCELEPTENRAPRACFSVERFVWLSKLNNLKVGVAGQQRPLTDTERRKLMDLELPRVRGQVSVLVL